MDNGSGIMPVMPMGGDGLGGIGGAGFWIFALLILGMMGNNGFMGGNNAYATSAEMQTAFDNQNLQAQTRDILSAVNAGTAQSVAATNQTFHDSLSAMQGLYNETARDIAGLAVGQANALANQNECCCNTRLAIQETSSATQAAIAQNRYEAAMNTASINANTTAQIQSIKDMLAQDKIEALQNQVNALQLAQATASVVRYPTSTVYSSGCNPFCGCGCGSI